MKCPKCDYLGFDTGDRCKNCGYDFSLVTEEGDRDLPLHGPAALMPETHNWPDRMDGSVTPLVVDAPARMQTPPIRTPSALGHTVARDGRRETDARLPLFRPAGDEADDEPLIKLPASPRPPLAVRKTPEIPRLRAVPRPAVRTEDPVLQFADEGTPEPERDLRDAAPAARSRRAGMPLCRHSGVSAAGPRLGAALIDHTILCSVDATVIYLTLRMAGLSFEEWGMLPLAPLLTFLVLVKFAYFCAFTAVGGQTIGKMAVSIRVVSDSDTAVDAECAIRRTLAGLGSAVLGLGFVPAFFDSEHRAFHDRVAHTRVVALRSV